MKRIYLAFMVLILSFGLLKAQTVVYDFEILTPGNLNGQAGWVTTQHPTASSGDMQIMANAGINGDSKTLYYGISGAGYGADASHTLSAGMFSDQMDSYKISFDFAPAVWGTNVGIGYDANMDGKISSSDLSEMSIIYNSTSTYVNVTLPSGQTTQIPTAYSGNWVHIEMTITDLVLGGKLKVTELDLVTGITRIIASDVDINATASSNNTNPDNWNMIYTHIEGAVGLIDNIKIEKNPASCSVEILADASLCTNMPAIFNANAIVNLGSNYQTNNTIFPIPDGIESGIGSPIEVVNSTALASEIFSVTINSLTHEWVNDLKLILIAPDGSELALANNVGMDGDNFIGTTFILGALQNIETGTAPFTGEYNPSQSFNSLTGTAQGIWILKVIDEYTGAAGTLDSWSLNIPGENSIVNYSWSTGQSGSDLSQISLVPVSASSVYVTVTDLNGDIASAQFDYTVSQSPDVTVTGTANICENASALITANAVAFGYVGGENLELSNSNPVPIPDYYAPGVNSQIVVPNSEEMANELVSVTINSLSHSYVEDLAIYLTAPDGSWITLAANIGGAGDGYTETEFTASASDYAQFGTAPFTGQFLPVDMISTLTGSAQGVWTLKIVDNTATETGTLFGWTLKLPNYNSIVNYTWSNGANGIDVNEITPSPSTNTLYTVVALDANGCEGTGDFNVSIYPAPTVDITEVNDICLGSEVTLTAVSSADQTIPLVITETNDTPIVIPDNDLNGILSPITIAQSDALASELLSVRINLLTHTWIGDVVISLIAPDGSSILLQSSLGLDGNSIVNEELSMSAVIPITAAASPFTGQFIPEQSFSNLSGSAQGTWYLKVFDNAGGDQGTLFSWTLNIPAVNQITNYAWSSGESGIDYSAIITSPSSSTTYNVTVTDSKGCVNSDLVDVTVNIPLDVVITQNLGTLTSSATTGNQWYEESLGLIAGETNQNFTPLADGTYFCGVTDENNCYEVSNSIDFIYSDISNFNQNARVSVYPNPNNGIFSLEINSDLDQRMQIQLVNVQGQIVYFSQIEVSSNFSEDFNFSDLAPGIYSLHLINGDFNDVCKIVIR